MPGKTDEQPPQNGHEAELPPMEPLAMPEGDSDRQPSIGEAIGIGSGGHVDDNIIGKIYEGATPLTEWGPRGSRSRDVLLSEVDIYVENATLASTNFRVRADYMAKVLKGDSYKALFGPSKREMSRIEMGGLIILGVAVCATLFLIATVYA